MPAIRILIATLMRPDGDTGVQTHFTTFMRWLSREGRPATLVTPYSAPSWQTHPLFALRRLIDPLNGAWSVWWYRHWHAYFVRRSLDRELASGAPCVVYAQCPPSAQAALQVRRSPAQRVVLVVHFNESQAAEWVGKGKFEESHPLYARIQQTEAATLSNVDALVFVSQFMRQKLVERIPTAVSIFEVIPNFVDDPFAASGHVGESSRSAIRVSARRDLISIGTLEPRKNQSYLLDIVAAAQDLDRPLTLTIVGDGEDMHALRAKAEALGIDSLVRFDGRVSNAAALMSDHRACIHVALQESFGIVLIEALARGLPVFASPVGGIPEVFNDSVQGRFIPLESPDEAAAIVLSWMDDARQLERAGVEGRQRYLNHFETNGVARRLTSFLCEDEPLHA